MLYLFLDSVAGFYLASDPSLELTSAVRLDTFASSRVGCRTFQQSFKHLEETVRFLHAKFTNSNDMVSLRPFWDVNGSWKFDDWYQVREPFVSHRYSMYPHSHRILCIATQCRPKHVGMHIHLHANNAHMIKRQDCSKGRYLQKISNIRVPTSNAFLKRILVRSE